MHGLARLGWLTVLVVLVMGWPSLAAEPAPGAAPQLCTKFFDLGEGSAAPCAGTLGPTVKIAKLRKAQIDLVASEAHVEELETKLQTCDETCEKQRAIDAVASWRQISSCDARARSCEARVADLAEDQGMSVWEVSGIATVTAVVAFLIGFAVAQ